MHSFIPFHSYYISSFISLTSFVGPKIPKYPEEIPKFPERIFRGSEQEVNLFYTVSRHSLS